MSENKQQRGRPSLWSEEIAQDIAERIALGEPLAEICRTPGYPAVRTVCDWKDPGSIEYKGDAFSALIARARVKGFDAIAESCLEIADDARNDWMTRRNAEGDEGAAQINSEHIQRSKLRIETRLKLLAKWDPKRYGERLELAGEVAVKRSAADLSDDELAAIALGKHASPDA